MLIQVQTSVSSCRLFRDVRKPRRRRNRSRSHSRNTSRSEPSSKRVRTSTSESRNRKDGDQNEFRRYLHKLDKKLENLETNIADSSRESLP